ncbi:caspase family protein [Amycolatopsis orientalis]|uniref:caspase family protein n=1 Tax=Amycolatopsis orientalis TaxID=31958 RepID=UPI0004063A91|nr:caspase family protein [Amycolatopsis orientalis]
MHDDGDQPRRYLIATAVAQYPKAPQWDRPGLVQARDEIIRLFTDELGYQHVSTLGLNPTKDQLTMLLRAFCRDEAREPDDLVAVYIGSHGEVLEDTREHALLTTDVDPDDVDDALPTAELARKMLLKTRVRRVLLMLDTCYAGQGGSELTAVAITKMTRSWGDDDGSGLAVITSAQPCEQAKTGAFPLLLRDAIRGLPIAGYNPATLPLDSIVKAMNTSASKPGHQTIGHSVASLTGEVPPFLPNPRHHPRMTEVDLAIQHASEFEVQAERRDTEFRTRLLVRAMGGSSRGSDGWWFAGRHTALLDITAWLHHPDPERPLQVVTGNPGSGKTAVLGLIAALTHPQRRATVPLHTLGLPGAAVPEPGTVHVAIYAQSLSTDQVLAGIAAAVHSHASTPGQLIEALNGRDTPLTVLVDALDEAADPDHLTRRLLRPLVDHAQGQLRLLVGTRDFLLDRLGLDREDSIDLDADRYADLGALTAYAARGLLEASPDSPYLDTPPPIIRAVADAVAAAANPSFLVARITSATLAAQHQAVDPADSAWRRSLPTYPGEAMHRDLESRLGTNAAKARDLLRPLAFAEGQGLPWEDIWAAVATKASGAAYTDDDLLWLRRHAGSYVVEATEFGRSTYRLYHQALADYLRNDITSPNMHRAVAEALHERVPRTLDSRRDWSHAHPYILRHLATHAKYAGLLDDLITDTDYLVHADPSSLLLALLHTATNNGATIAAIYRCSADIHRNLPASRRRQILAVDAARFQATRLQRDLSTTLTFPPLWATGHQTNPSLLTTFTGHSGAVGAVACGDLNGRLVSVTVGNEGDGRLRVWDCISGAEMTTFDSKFITSEAGVAFTVVNGRPTVMTIRASVVDLWDAASASKTATYDNLDDLDDPERMPAQLFVHTNGGRCFAITGRSLLHVWDLDSKKRVSDFLGHVDSKESVLRATCGTVNGRLVIATVGSRYAQTTVRVWELETAKEIATFSDHAGYASERSAIIRMKCGTVNGRDVALTAITDTSINIDTRVQVWELATGKKRAILIGHTGPVLGIALGEFDGSSVAVTASSDQTARVWDLATGEQLISLVGHTGSVNAVACGSLDGQMIAVTASRDTTARVWRPKRSRVNRSANSGHRAPIESIACAQFEGHSVVVTASVDGTARVWNMVSANEIAEFAGHSSPVRGVACGVLDGQHVAVTCGQDGYLRIWNLLTTEELFHISNTSGRAFDVAFDEVHSRTVVVTASSADGTINVWSLASGEEIARFSGDASPVSGIACCELDHRTVAITASDDGLARVWDIITAEEIAIFAHRESRLTGVACGVLNDRTVAVTVGTDGVARVWDLQTARQISTFARHISPIISVACGESNARTVAITASRDGTVRVWDLETADELEMFDVRGVRDVTIGPEGEFAIAAGWDVIVLNRSGL